MSELPEESEPETFESWDAFWSEVQGSEQAKTETIRGVKVRVPTELTVRFAQRAEALQTSTKLEDITGVLGDLYGKDVMETWLDAGMELLEFQTVFAWSLAHAMGKPISFRQALAQVRELDQAKTSAQGKGKGR